MKLAKKDEAICKKYSALDETGHVHCNECPLVRESDVMICACKANSHYDRKEGTWVPDSWKGEP